VAFYGLYSAIRDLHGPKPVSEAVALANARRVISLERSVGIFHEEAVQHLFLHLRPVVEALDVWYGVMHFVVTVGVLVFLWLRHPSRYLRWRNTLAVATALALVGFAVFPLMPPRLLPSSYGFVDTLSKVGGLWNFNSGPINDLSNQYAAMPSLHFAWALWSALALIPTLTRRWAKLAMAYYPAITFVCVIVTANHYFTDVAAGAAIVGIGYALSRGWERIRSGLSRDQLSRVRPDTG